MFRTIFDAENKLWSGKEMPPIFDPRSNLGSLILSALKANGPRVAQICAKTNATTTFNELYDQTICVAKNLKKLGFQKGEVISISTENFATITPFVFAALCLGCIVSSSTLNSLKREIIHDLKITKPKYVFCDLNYYDKLIECIEDVNLKPLIFTFDGQTGDSIAIEILFDKSDADSDSVTDFIPVEVDAAKDIAFIGRSSGSTGKPKGIPMPHASITDLVGKFSSFFNSSDVVLHFSGPYTISGIRALVGATLNGSTRIVNPGTFSPEHFFELVERFKVTLIHLGMFFVRQLLHHPQIETANLSSFKHFICSGTKVTLEAIHKMNKYLVNGKFFHGYGLTETFGWICINVDHQRNDCVGQLIGGCYAKIVNDRGERLGIDEEGELCVKQLYPFPGYLVADENAQGICFDHEGFLITGDIARFDENGDLFIVSRKKEIFKCGVTKISPAEIEEFLNELDGVKQSCLVAIPDSAYGSIPAAVIVKTPGSNCTESSICDAVSDNFSSSKHLKGGVYFVESIPMTEIGKIARHLVNQMAIELHMKRETLANTTNNLQQNEY